MKIVRLETNTKEKCDHLEDNKVISCTLLALGFHHPSQEPFQSCPLSFRILVWLENKGSTYIFI